ncbi:MAG: hypothetical protein KGS45_03515 [Planctomycetes bacterium]|nr:hypothetical protein [Planctomycetota bacterium]
MAHSTLNPINASRVQRLVPFVHVATVQTSIEFYSLLGFMLQHVMSDSSGRPFWAMLQSGDDASKAEIMFAVASGPVNASQQAVLFYMYSSDVATLRQHLLASGVRDGGMYAGCATPNDGPGMVYEIAHPAHMPAGELRVIDPDGYVILVGQLQ